MSIKKIEILDEFEVEIPNSQLPTKSDVIKAIYYEKESQKINFDAAIKVVSGQISGLWSSSGIPAVSKRATECRAQVIWKKYRDICRIPASRPSRKSKEDLFKVRI